MYIFLAGQPQNAHDDLQFDHHDLLNILNDLLFVHDDFSFVQKDMSFEDNEQKNKHIRQCRRSIVMNAHFYGFTFIRKVPLDTGQKAPQR